MNKILITTSTFDHNHKELDTLMTDFNATLIFNPYKRKLTHDELTGLMDRSVIGIIAGVEKINKNALDLAPSLRVISRCGVGVEGIDLVEAKKRGIKVCITPDAPTQSVAELVLSMMLTAVKHLVKYDNNMREGIWNRMPSSLLSSKTVGIIGYGRIGQRVASLLSGFDVNTIYYDKVISKSDYAEPVNDLNELLKQSDIVSLHIPHIESTDGIVDAHFLSAMKKESVLINTARGALIVESDLERHLQQYPNFVACLDVFAEEPYSGILGKLPNTVLTPHIGSYTRETRMRMECESLINLITGLKLKEVSRLDG